MEQEYQGKDYYDIRQAWKQAQHEIGLYQTTSTPFCMDLAATIQVFIDENVCYGLTGKINDSVFGLINWSVLNNG